MHRCDRFVGNVLEERQVEAVEMEVQNIEVTCTLFDLGNGRARPKTIARPDVGLHHDME